MMDISVEFFQVVAAFNRGRVPYAVVGGIALSFYGEPRYTKDIDFLIAPSDVSKAKSLLKELGYDFEAKDWTFPGTALTLHRISKIQDDDTMTIDLLAGEGEIYQEVITEALRADDLAGMVSVARKEHLIWLKKKRNSKQDQADIEALENESH